MKLPAKKTLNNAYTLSLYFDAYWIFESKISAFLCLFHLLKMDNFWLYLANSDVHTPTKTK